MANDVPMYHIPPGEEAGPARIALWRVLCRHWFSRFIPPDAVTLDLGAGRCEFINNICCAERIALDHDPELPKRAGEGVKCIVAELRDGLLQLPDGSVDRILASNLFEHLPDRQYLAECLWEARRVMRPGGKLLVMQPNIAAVKARFYDFSDHTLPLTEKGMADLLARCGYEIERVKARFLPYTTHSRYPAWPILVRLYLLCPLAHWFMGGQMFIVARKGGS